MTTQPSILSHFNSILICLVALLITTVFIACNNSGETEGISKSGLKLKPGNWVSLEIKFQPNTDGERRDKSIKAIERMLLNSVTPLMREYKDYYPSMRVTWTPFADSLHYWVDVINTYGIGTAPTMYTMSKDTTPTPPTCPACPTPNPCRICDSLITYTGNPAFGIAAMTIVDTK